MATKVWIGHLCWVWDFESMNDEPDPDTLQDAATPQFTYVLPDIGETNDSVIRAQAEADYREQMAIHEQEEVGKLTWSLAKGTNEENHVEWRSYTMFDDGEEVAAITLHGVLIPWISPDRQTIA